VEVIYFSEPSEKVKAAKEAPLIMLVPTYVVIGATVVFGCWTVYSAQIAQLAADALLGLIFLFGKIPNLRDGCSIVVSGVLFWITCQLAQLVFNDQRPELVIGEMIPGFKISFSIEPLGMIFALVASGLWILTTIYAIGYMRGHDEKNQTRFFACFAAAIFAALSAAYAANLLTLFVAYEVMTISTYPLVTHNGDEEARRGGRVYLGILISTSIAFFLFAIVWTGHIAGTLDFVPGGVLQQPFAEGKISPVGLAALLALFTFGIGKAALMPFHRWLPAAMVAPTPISDWLCYLAAASILLASLVAMTKDNLKARLAYSTISQLAYITLGALLASESSVIGGGMHIVMHAVGKITLFFCAGAIYVGAHKKNISDMRGLGRAMPLTFAAFLVASISIIGLPPGGGSWSKWFLAVGCVESGQAWLMGALMISSLLNIAYLVPIPVRAFMTPKGEEPQKWHEAPMMCVVPLCITAVGSVVLMFFADAIYQVLLKIV